MPSRAPGGGRKPKPTRLRILEGNPGRRPLNKEEPKPKPKLGSPPKELSLAAKREWRRTGKVLLMLGVMTELDGAALAAFVQPYTQWLEVTALLNTTGPIINDQVAPDGKPLTFKINPLHSLARDLQMQWTRALTEFGMTPSSRSRLHAAPQEIEAEDPLEQLRMRRAE